MSNLIPAIQSREMTEEKPSLLDIEDLSDDEDAQGCKIYFLVL